MPDPILPQVNASHLDLHDRLNGLYPISNDLGLRFVQLRERFWNHADPSERIKSSHALDYLSNCPPTAITTEPLSFPSTKTRNQTPRKPIPGELLKYCEPVDECECEMDPEKEFRVLDIRDIPIIGRKLPCILVREEYTSLIEFLYERADARPRGGVAIGGQSGIGKGNTHE